VSRAADAIVVGGGVVGAAVAWSLASRGLAVRLVERGELAGEASGAAAGMLTPIGEGHAPGPALRARLASFALFPALVDAVREGSGIDPEYVVSGSLRVAADAVEARALAAQAEQHADFGLVWLAPAEVERSAPGIAPGLRAHGALFSPRDAHVRSPLLARAFAAAAERLGARVETGVAVRGLLRDGERVCGAVSSAGALASGLVVLCPGSFAAECAAWIGPGARLPIEPVRGQIVALELPPAMPRAIVWGRGKGLDAGTSRTRNIPRSEAEPSEAGVYLVPKLDGSLVVGATTERVGFDRRVTAAGVATLLRAAEALVPEAGGARFLGAWAGLRPDTPDHLPLVGPWPGAPGLVVAAGHYRNGVLLAPLTGRLVADGVLGKGWAEPAFDPARFL
jgi:glycine oxidase